MLGQVGSGPQAALGPCAASTPSLEGGGGPAAPSLLLRKLEGLLARGARAWLPGPL